MMTATETSAEAGALTKQTGSPLEAVVEEQSSTEESKLPEDEGAILGEETLEGDEPDLMGEDDPMAEGDEPFGDEGLDGPGDLDEDDGELFEPI